MPAVFRSPIWSSAFRPFYLLGTLYAPLLMLAWLGAHLGIIAAPTNDAVLKLWHGHEMIYGFAAAIITGIVFTALPSWAGTPELRGGPLALLVALWLAGRCSVWLEPWLPAPWTAGVDCALFLVAAVMVTPSLLRVSNRLYLLLLPILLGLFAGNALYHAGLGMADDHLAMLGLRLGVYSIVLLYILKGGVLTPIFTGNALRAKGRGDQAPFIFALEAAGVLSLLALAAADLLEFPAPWIVAAALAAALIHGWRLLRWRGWKIRDEPLVLVMHIGFVWLVIAFLLRAGAALTPRVAESAWLHAFTVGSLGMMMLGLMTRVVLRHTGRTLIVPAPIRLAYAAMFAAAVIRVGAALFDVDGTWIAVSALLWAAAFAVYPLLFARALIAPSLPRESVVR